MIMMALLSEGRVRLKEKKGSICKNTKLCGSGGEKHSFETVQSESPRLLISIKMLHDFYETNFRTSDPSLRGKKKTSIQGFKLTDKRQFN